MSVFINYYEVLHVSQDAPVEIIKLAYKGLAQKYHPDRYKGADANEKMHLLNEALEILSNPLSRANYDIKLNDYNQQKQKEHDANEYRKRQQQEAKQNTYNQSANNKNTNSYSSNEYTAQNTQGSDSDFNINININISKGLNLFKPFKIIYLWFKNHKHKIRNLIYKIAILIGICVFIAVIINFFNNSNEQTGQISEATAASEETWQISEETAASEETATASEPTAAAPEFMAPSYAEETIGAASNAEVTLQDANNGYDSHNDQQNTDISNTVEYLAQPDLHSFDSGYLNLEVWINRKDAKELKLAFTNAKRPELNTIAVCNYSHGNNEGLTRYSSLIKKQLSISLIYTCDNNITLEIATFKQDTTPVVLYTLSNTMNPNRVYFSGAMMTY